MMKNNNDLDYIRLLLEKYYNADTTCNEEEILRIFFSEKNAADIPKDMEADRKLFSVMKEFDPLPSECEAPHNLINRIEDIMTENPAMPTIVKRNRWHKLIGYSGICIAAAAMFAFAIITFVPKRPDSKLSTPMDYTAENVEMPTVDTSVDDTTLITEESNHTATQNSQQDLESDNQYNEPKEESDEFIEVTDPEEVRKIALGIGKLLAYNSEKTNDAISHISTTIDSYKEITKSILKNETN